MMVLGTNCAIFLEDVPSKYKGQRGKCCVPVPFKTKQKLWEKIKEKTIGVAPCSNFQYVGVYRAFCMTLHVGFFVLCMFSLSENRPWNFNSGKKSAHNRVQTIREG
eukprot:6466434-Amphidinium_carterae.1